VLVAELPNPPSGNSHATSTVFQPYWCQPSKSVSSISAVFGHRRESALWLRTRAREIPGGVQRSRISPRCSRRVRRGNQYGGQKFNFPNKTFSLQLFFPSGLSLFCPLTLEDAEEELFVSGMFSRLRSPETNRCVLRSRRNSCKSASHSYLSLDPSEFRQSSTVTTSLSGVTGRSRTRLPIAWKMALQIAPIPRWQSLTVAKRSFSETGSVQRLLLWLQMRG